MIIPIDSVVHYYRHIEINIILRLLKKKKEILMNAIGVILNFEKNIFII